MVQFVRKCEKKKKYCRAGQATDDNTIRCVLFACWVTKAIDTHSEYVIIIVLPWQRWLRERVRYYVIRALCLVTVLPVYATTSRSDFVTAA